MKNTIQNGTRLQIEIRSIKRFELNSLPFFIRKLGLLLFLFGVLLATNSCDNEEQAPPVTNEPDPTGNIVVKISTVGNDFDPEGYVLNVEGTAARQVGANEEITINNIKVGRYSVNLSGIASHCTGTGNMVQEVNVTANGTATVEFEVSCKAILRDRIAYNKGTANFTDFKFYSSNLDGTDERMILDRVISPNRMSISPDGTKIAFVQALEGTTVFQIFLMDADGENIEMIPFEERETPAMSAQFFPVWHPNGEKITFRNATRVVTYDLVTGNRTVLEFDLTEIFQVHQVFDNGNKFLGIFIGGSSGHKLATMNSDGSDVKILKEGGNLLYTTPTIMNENTIAYIQRVNTPGFFNEFWKMNLDGTEDVKLNSSLGFSESEVINSFTVSPDGTEFITFVSNGPNFYLYRAKPNSSPQQLNFSSPGIRNNPVWSPVTR